MIEKFKQERTLLSNLLPRHGIGVRAILLLSNRRGQMKL